MMNIITVKHWIFEKVGIIASGYNRAIVWDSVDNRAELRDGKSVMITGEKVKETEKAIQFNLMAISDRDALEFGANINCIPDDITTYTWSAWIPKSAIIGFAIEEV